jgi:hypothetical protein
MEDSIPYWIEFSKYLKADNISALKHTASYSLLQQKSVLYFLYYWTQSVQIMQYFLSIAEMYRSSV